MRAAVISDTHDAIFSTQDVLNMIAGEGVDTISHCGDMTTAYTAELFKDFCIYHAWGNNDYDTSASQPCIGGVLGVFAKFLKIF